MAKYLRPSTLAFAIFYSFVVVLFCVTLGKYPGAWYSYLLFTIAFNALLFLGFRRTRLFFDSYIGMFFWLGFWLKFSFSISFGKLQFGESIGLFDFTGPAFDLALNISSCGAIALLLASYFRQMVFSYSTAKSSAGLKALETVYSRFKKPIWWGFVILVVLVTVTNAYFGFYQKGLPPRTVLPFGLSGIYSLAILFGLASISAILLGFETKSNQSPYAFSILAMTECFFSNVSMLSRGMILNGSSIIMGLYENARVKSADLNRAYMVTIISVFLGLFGFSFFSVNYVRDYIYEVPGVGILGPGDKQPAISDSASHSSVANITTPAMSSTQTSRATSFITKIQGAVHTTHMNAFINRWVGIEGVMSVSSYPGIGYDLWRTAWREKYNSIGTSWYDRTIAGDGPYLAIKEGKHFITLPGIIAFFYYPGSIIFLFISMVGLGLFGAAIEVAVYKLSGSNIILAALLGQVVAARYAHFGYVPRQSYLLLGGIFVVVCAVFVLNALLSLLTDKGTPPIEE